MYVHLLNLDTIGGVETLYAFFLQEELRRKRAVHHTIVSGRPPHKKFSDLFSKIGHKPFLERYLWKFRIPKIAKSIVSIRRQIIGGLIKPSYWVYWNRIEERPPPGRALYYEHGAAWTVSPTKKRKEFLSSCSFFLANSKAAACMLREKWAVDDPIHVICNPLRPDLPIAENPRQLSSTTPLRLGFLGRLVPIKGLGVAIQTLKELRDLGIEVTLSIAGEGSEKKYAEKLSQKLGVSSSVIWCGAVFDIASFFDTIDILLIPSIREPLGLVALEAAASAVPVVASEVDGLPEVIEDGTTGITVAPTLNISHAGDLIGGKEGFPDCVVSRGRIAEPKVVDPKLYARAIMSLCDNNTYLEISKKCLEQVRDRIDFSSYCDILEDHLQTHP
jgi:glycosyltransferase involved in cell wall biosynthesis